MDLGARPEHQKDQVEKDDQAGFQAGFRVFSRHLRQCFFPPDQREKSDFVQRMDQARLPADRSFFKKGGQPDRGGCRNVRRSVRIRGPVHPRQRQDARRNRQVLGSGRGQAMEGGDRSSSLREGAMETGFGQRNRVQDRNHSRSRSPHPGGPREERLFDALAGTPAPRSGGDLPTGRVDHFASNRSGQWTDPRRLSRQGRPRSKGRKNRPENGSIGSSAMPWPGSLALGEKHSRGGGVRIRRQPGNGRPLWMVFMHPEFQIIR